MEDEERDQWLDAMDAITDYTESMLGMTGMLVALLDQLDQDEDMIADCREVIARGYAQVAEVRQSVSDIELFAYEESEASVEGDSEDDSDVDVG